MGWLTVLGEYLAALFATAGAGLSLNAAAVQSSARFFWSVPIGVAIVAGISTMTGQAAVLAINRVTGWRRILTLLASGILLIVNAAIQALGAALATRVLTPISLPAHQLLPAVLISYAPFWLGFLVLLPYSGPGVARVLQVWNLIALWTLLTAALDTTPAIGLAVAGVAWLGSVLVNFLVQKSGLKLRRRFLRWASGTSWLRPADFREAVELPAEIGGVR